MNEKDSEKALKILGQQYENFINLQDSWDFFRGLAEYIKTVQELTETKPIVEALEKQKELARMVYEQMNASAFKEFTKSAEQLTKIAEKFAIPREPVHIARSIKEVQDYLNGSIWSSDALSGINHVLFDIARQMKMLGLSDKIKQFVDDQRRVQNIYGNYVFSPTYETLYLEKEKLERKEQVEPWGAWEQLPLVKRLVFEPEEITTEFKAEAEANPNLKWSLFNFFGVAGELEKIRSGEKIGFGKLSDDDAVFFKVKDFKSFARRFHNYLMSELLKSDATIQKLDFDDASSALYFAGESITISKRAQNDAHDLLRTIFKA